MTHIFILNNTINYLNEDLFEMFGELKNESGNVASTLSESNILIRVFLNPK